MGRRVCFLKTNNNSSLDAQFSQHAEAFRDWLLAEHATSMAEFKEPLCSEQLATYLAGTAKPDIRQMEKTLADEMLIAFIGDYCDRAPAGRRLQEIIGPLMNVGTYDKSLKQLVATKDQQLIQYWNYIMYGRSLLDNASQTEEFEDYYGFLDRAERQKLTALIETYFPSTEEIGFACLLDALSEMKDEDGDMIVFVA